ncbi:MAG: hypothetical protein AB9842_14495 [Bacteroidales bacterium]
MINSVIQKSRRILPGILCLLLVIPLWLKGQEDTKFDGMAGPDKNTCINPQTGQTQPVQIGETSISGWCYTWTPATGLDNPHAARPMASPSQTTTYHLKITFDNFTNDYEDDMVVNVREGVNTLHVTPKKCCFKAGETFTYDMFNITTDPPGLENKVTFSPDKAPTQNWFKYNSTITVSVGGCQGGGDVTDDVLVSVVNENYTSGIVLGFPFKYAEKWNKAKQKIDDYMELFNNNIGTKIPLCAPDPFDWSVQFKYSEGFLCCPDKTPCEDTAYAGSLGAKLQGGFTCDFPFYGIPHIAALNVRVQGTLAISATGNYKSLCQGFELCFPVGITGTLGGGVSGTIFAKAALDASILLRGTVSAEPIKFCVSPSWKIEGSSKICTSLDAVGTVKLISLVTIQGVWPITSKSCFPLL